MTVEGFMGCKALMIPANFGITTKLTSLSSSSFQRQRQQQKQQRFIYTLFLSSSLSSSSAAALSLRLMNHDYHHHDHQGRFKSRNHMFRHHHRCSSIFSTIITSSISSSHLLNANVIVDNVDNDQEMNITSNNNIDTSNIKNEGSNTKKRKKKKNIVGNVITNQEDDDDDDIENDQKINMTSYNITERNNTNNDTDFITTDNHNKKKKIVIVGAGWGGLSAAYQLALVKNNYEIIIIESSNRVGGLVRDGYRTINNLYNAEAGQHGFWYQYYNIYHLLQNELKLNMSNTLTEYNEQGQYSPNGLQAIWPIFNNIEPKSLPTGIGQALYTNFLNIPWTDRITAIPMMVTAFSDFLNDDEQQTKYRYYDNISFYDLCLYYKVSKRCYNEIMESMILTGLFVPGTQCSSAAALSMAYFFVLQQQNAFDVQWCKGNIGTIIFDPWIQYMTTQLNVTILYNTSVTNFQIDNNNNTIAAIECVSTNNNKGMKLLSNNSNNTNENSNNKMIINNVDDIVIAVGAKALNSFATYTTLNQYEEFRRFSNLRGTSVLATRIYLNKYISIPYTANACYGFDNQIGMTMFDITTLHGYDKGDHNGSIIEVDYYYANALLCLNDTEIIQKVKNDLDIILGHRCRVANVLDAAIIRIKDGVNWYYPNSYNDLPDMKSKSINNLYFVGDIVRNIKHGSWSQEKAYVSGIYVSNLILNRTINTNIISLPKDELHVQLGQYVLSSIKQFLPLL